MRVSVNREGEGEGRNGERESENLYKKGLPIDRGRDDECADMRFVGRG